MEEKGTIKLIKSYENEGKNRKIGQNLKNLEEIKGKISFLNQENLCLQKSIEELSGEAFRLNEGKNKLVINYNEAKAKYNKLQDNYTLCVSEVICYLS